MNDLISMSDLVALAGDELITYSRKVAKHFGKRHSDILRAVKNMECSTGFRERNFALTMIDVRGPKGATRQEPAYTMTKDGFMFAAMGFTGTKAAELKEAYIAAFNDMAGQLRNQSADLWAQMQALISKEVSSQVRASFGSHLMLKRKKEVPSLREERGLLEGQLQPSLLAH